MSIKKLASAIKNNQMVELNKSDAIKDYANDYYKRQSMILDKKDN